MSTSHFHLPYGYVEAPPWPSLYWPFGPNFNPLSLIADIPHSLYYMKDIWRFTVLWSLIFAIAVYFPAGKGIVDIINDRRIKLLAPNNNLDHNQGIWAYMMFLKSHTFKWYMLVLVPLIFVVAGGLSSFIIGSIVGVVLAIIYNAGFFVMSTWIPFLWALIQVLIVVIGSYSTITTIL